MTGSHTFTRWCTWCVALMILASAACSRQPVAHEYRSTPVEGWEPGDTLKFRIDTLRESGIYRLTLGVRTSASKPYPFRSVWLVVRQHWHRPDTLLIDTVECVLTDEKGDIAGHGVSLYQYRQPLPRIKHSEGSRAELSITHIMRREMIPGISAVGFRFEREE